MGGIHDGHLSLVRVARFVGETVVASIFVNRLQFGPDEDYERYPRTREADCALLETAGCDIVFAPDETDIYPELQGYTVRPPAVLADVLEGASRPGFFVGVCTVVLKLFNLVSPKVAVFGKKDWQQLLVIRRMVEQLALPIEIGSGETIREPDGLALSSRNAYLTPAERPTAASLYRTLSGIAKGLRRGDRGYTRLERNGLSALERHGLIPHYVAIRRRSDLGEPHAQAKLVVLGAATLGRARLIDNIEI
jgi:pantoate--beta-alanine ligase